MTENSDRPIRPPMHEAIWPKDLFENGIGWVIIARFKSAGERVEVGVFLLDIFCLGVKLAAYEIYDRLTYLKDVRGYYEAEFPMEPVEPACARKLIEKAVEYAQGLGFAPHSDYKKAARVFGGIRAEQCIQDFSFGREGKPFYFRGPNETEEQARRIVWQLEKRCGLDNYNYVVGLGDSEDLSRTFD